MGPLLPGFRTSEQHIMSGEHEMSEPRDFSQFLPNASYTAQFQFQNQQSLPVQPNFEDVGGGEN